MPSLFIVLNNVRSAWNVGAIMRTCDALQAKLILVGYTPKPIGNTLKLIKKTAIGAESTVSWESYSSFQEVLQKYPQKHHFGIEISVSSQDIFAVLKNKQYLDKDIALWFGNEISGLEKDLERQLEMCLHLPMNGLKESLNVASTVCTAGYLWYGYIHNQL